MSAIWEWLVGPQSDCLRLVSAALLLVAWLTTRRPSPAAGCAGHSAPPPGDC